MDSDRTNIIWMCFKLGDFFTSVVIIDSNLEIIRSNNDPILTSNETTRTNWNFGNINGFYFSLWGRRLVFFSSFVRAKSIILTPVSYDHISTRPIWMLLVVYSLDISRSTRTRIKSSQYPWLSWMEIDSFDSISPGTELFLEIGLVSTTTTHSWQEGAN